MSRVLNLRVKHMEQIDSYKRFVFLDGPGLSDDYKNGTIYFQFSKNIKLNKGFCYDSFLFGFIFLAMSMFDEFHLDRPITDLALRNITSFQEAWTNMKPNVYKRLKLFQRQLFHLEKSSKKMRQFHRFQVVLMPIFLL